MSQTVEGLADVIAVAARLVEVLATVDDRDARVGAAADAASLLRGLCAEVAIPPVSRQGRWWDATRHRATPRQPKPHLICASHSTEPGPAISAKAPMPARAARTGPAGRNRTGTGASGRGSAPSRPRLHRVRHLPRRSRGTLSRTRHSRRCSTAKAKQPAPEEKQQPDPTRSGSC